MEHYAEEKKREQRSPGSSISAEEKGRPENFSEKSGEESEATQSSQSSRSYKRSNRRKKTIPVNNERSSKSLNTNVSPSAKKKLRSPNTKVVVSQDKRKRPDTKVSSRQNSPERTSESEAEEKADREERKELLRLMTLKIKFRQEREEENTFTASKMKAEPKRNKGRHGA